MGKTIKAASTIHYHFAFGNIPAGITEEDMTTIFSELWVNKANQSHKKLWLHRADETNMGWLWYGHNENKLGEHLGFDMNACFTPERLGN